MVTDPAPLVIAHRGSSAVVPEHTLAAYRQAVVEGADALECDVRLTRDGQLVCVHDRWVDRTSDGHGKVSLLELEDLSSLDFGSWRDAEVQSARLEATWEDADRRRVLTFERLLKFWLSVDRPIGLHVETKHPTRYAGLVEQRLVEMLREHGLTDPTSPAVSPVTVMSFSAVGLRRFRLLAPLLPRVFLIEKRLPQVRRDGLLPYGVRNAGLSIRLTRAFPDYVRAAHARGHRVHVFTVDDPADVELVLDLGVDGIITNRPAQVLGRLGRG